ncbi:efflux RND transporter periplasmic adaptor subunit [Ruegeria sp. 2012CJ41-6]|uniref:Efflux RND transporter periplasmic adaptor subunit n=1 Tax=Ruegeria spongiae TaxID=2942209 RepID=A0ABT0Q0U6_9RHOB|nr:efflux RND transporter periplasmic adaptor subunit [Ruegeria spongiae]MCL6282559.1 efflux RND transporter periplasmic adaptor subunit [Ruegeria spongiae]
MPIPRLVTPCLFTLCLGGTAAAQTQDDAAPGVVVATVTSAVVQTADAYVGRVIAQQRVDLQARVEGILQEVNFIPGSQVSKGDVLFRIEQDVYEADVASARASVTGAEATAKGSDVVLKRNQNLLEKGDVPQSVVDGALADYGQDLAAVDQAKAALKLAQINLGYTEITSPLDGRIDWSSVDAGNVINSDSGVLATVTSVDPIYVSFFVSEGTLIDVRKKGLIADHAIKLKARIHLSDGSEYGTSGQVIYVGTQVRQDTDTIELRASFANPDGALLPGQFVSAFLEDAGATPSLTVPQSALQLDKDGHFVFVLDDKNMVHRQPVDTGQQIAGAWQITSGLKEGQKVVVQGLQKIHDGATVTPVDASGHPTQ